MQAAERLQRGEAAYKQQRYGEARKTLESLIEDFGDALYRSHLVIYSSLHHLTALCVELGDQPAAGGYCRRAISCLEEMFPADLRNWGGPNVVPALPVEPEAEAGDDDILDQPFIEDAGGAFGTMDSGLTDPEFILETDIIATLMSFNFDDQEWLLAHDSTVWEQHPGI